MVALPDLGQPNVALIMHSTLSAVLAILAGLLIIPLIQRSTSGSLLDSATTRVTVSMVTVMVVLDAYEVVVLSTPEMLTGASLATRLGVLGGFLVIGPPLLLLARRTEYPFGQAV